MQEVIIPLLILNLIVAVPVLLLILFIEALRKRPLKKLLYGIIGVYVALSLSPILMEGDSSAVFALLSMGFMVAFVCFVIALIVKAIKKMQLLKVSLGLIGSYLGVAVFLTLMEWDTKVFITFLLVSAFILAPIAMVVMIIQIVTKQPHINILLCLGACMLALFACSLCIMKLDSNFWCEHEFEVIEESGSTCIKCGEIIYNTEED